MTQTLYRLVHFVPDAAANWRIPVAALVSDGEKVRTVHTSMRFGATCLGGRRRAVLLEMVLKRLSAVESFDELPTIMGPHCFLSDPQNAPTMGFSEAVKWVESTVLPHQSNKRHGSNSRARSPERRIFGNQFFSTYGLGRQVRPTFEPAKDWDGRLAYLAHYGTASHWVPSEGSVLLLEPLTARRASFTKDVSEVAKLFASYKYELQTRHGRSGEALPATLIAFALTGTDEQKQDVRDSVSAADLFYDAESRSERLSLLTLIRQSASPPLPIAEAK